MAGGLKILRPLTDMKIELLGDAKIDGQLFKKGEIVDVQPHLAGSFIAGLIAVNPKKTVENEKPAYAFAKAGKGKK